MAIDVAKMEKAGVGAKHHTKNGDQIVVKGANSSVYFSAEDLDYLTKLRYTNKDVPRSKIISLGLKLVKEKYGTKLDKNDM